MEELADNNTDEPIWSSLGLTRNRPSRKHSSSIDATETNISASLLRLRDLSRLPSTTKEFAVPTDSSVKSASTSPNRFSFQRSSTIEVAGKKSRVYVSKHSVPYSKALDLNLQRAEYKALLDRITRHPVERACEKYACDKQTKEEKLNKRFPKRKEEINLAGNISEIFEGFESDKRKPWLPGSCQLAKDQKRAQGKKRAPEGIYALKGVALTDCKELTGKESRLLKRLLRTMRVKTWDPELYFQMNFFKMRHHIPPSSCETKKRVQDRWQMLTRMLRVLSRIDMIMAERSYEMTEKYPAFLDVTDASMKKIKYPSGIDRCVWKGSITGVILSIDAQGILRDKLPEERTEDDVEQVVTSLQYVDDFAKMAPDIQRRIVVGAYLHDLRSKRVVVRQGHVPQGIYFVLSGQAVAKQHLPPSEDGKSGLVRTTAVMKKGDCFGEFDLLEGLLRQSTVVTRTDVNLMVVSKEVLMEALYDPELRCPLDDPIVFLSKLWFMKGWPVDHLVHCPHQCRVRRYRRTYMIEKDTANSEWIYVVKEGTVKLFQANEVAPLVQSRRHTTRLVPQKRVTAIIVESCSGTSMSGKVSLSRASTSPYGTLTTEDDMSASQDYVSDCPPLLIEVPQERKMTESSSQSPSETPRHSRCSQPQEPRKMSAFQLRKQYKVPDRCKPPPRPTTPAEITYSLVKILRRYDVFGLEDLVLDPNIQPARKHYIMLSDEAVCVMLKKAYYLNFASRSLRQEVLCKLGSQHRKPYDCSLLGKAKLLPTGKFKEFIRREECCVHL